MNTKPTYRLEGRYGWPFRQDNFRRVQAKVTAYWSSPDLRIIWSRLNFRGLLAHYLSRFQLSANKNLKSISLLFMKQQPPNNGDPLAMVN